MKLDSLKSSLLKEIALLMKKNNHLRIEQEFVVNLWKENLIKVPNWTKI